LSDRDARVTSEAQQRKRRQVASRLAKNLIGCAVGASQKLRVPHRRAGDEVLGDLVIALRDLKKPLSYVFAVMCR